MLINGILRVYREDGRTLTELLQSNPVPTYIIWATLSLFSMSLILTVITKMNVGGYKATSHPIGFINVKEIPCKRPFWVFSIHSQFSWLYCSLQKLQPTVEVYISWYSVILV